MSIVPPDQVNSIKPKKDTRIDCQHIPQKNLNNRCPHLHYRQFSLCPQSSILGLHSKSTKTMTYLDQKHLLGKNGQTYPKLLTHI